MTIHYNLVLKQMLESRERFEAGWEILEQKDEVLGQIAVKIMTNLESEIIQKTKDIELVIKNDYKEYIQKNKYDKSFMGLRVKDRGWKEDIWLTLEAQGKWYKAPFCYGLIQDKEDTKMNHQDLCEMLEVEGKSSRWWPWYIYVEEKDFSLHDPSILAESLFVEKGNVPSAIAHMAERFAVDLGKLAGRI